MPKFATIRIQYLEINFLDLSVNMAQIYVSISVEYVSSPGFFISFKTSGLPLLCDNDLFKSFIEFSPITNLILISRTRLRERLFVMRDLYSEFISVRALTVLFSFCFRSLIPALPHPV